MPTDIKLTVLDQSPVHPPGATPELANAGRMSIELAKACEALGFSRYWVSEHHNSAQFAGPSPEILIASIAGATQRIRVGSGGVMLSHYSPFKVAEVFNMLSALYPGRIDLGIGRAPGGDMLASSALAWPAQMQNAENYPLQATTLKALLEKSIPDDHPWSRLHITPDHNSCPDLWMLGSSGGSAALAGQVGMKLALARFISPDNCTPDIFTNYDHAWMQANHPGKPGRMLAIGAFCAESGEEAKLLAGTAIYRKMMMQQGQREGLLAPEVVQDRRAKFSLSQESQYQHLANGYTIGEPDHCKREIEALAGEFGCDEIAIVTVTHDFSARLNSYRLLGEPNQATSIENPDTE
ncbi:luciferase [Chromatiales bacterium (ex Bugula neritina AB1)]|nr:luciferase [Chromatiales bacterium (ex Bugula neritina AB1)]